MSKPRIVKVTDPDECAALIADQHKNGRYREGVPLFRIVDGFMSVVEEDLIAWREAKRGP